MLSDGCQDSVLRISDSNVLHTIDTELTEPVAGENREEYEYLNLIHKILKFGEEREDRTGTGTISLFGERLRFCLKNDSFPLLTTKRVFFRGVVGELLWFLSGSTDASILANKNINIWKGNSSKEYMAGRGLGHYPENDLGPVYGWQWRHFGAEYSDMNGNYTGRGVDQIQRVIHSLKTNPFDRRHIVTAWNPPDLDKMALPPCHMFFQFHVSKDGYLSCQYYQRSCDIGLGLPFNIASYSLLTIMMAFITGYKPGYLTAVLGDTHVYKDHVAPLVTQLKRLPRSFPTLRIKEDSKIQNLEDFRMEHLVLENYNPYDKINMKMSV